MASNATTGITWHVDNDGLAEDPVTIEYSDDGGQDWTAINGDSYSHANDGSEPWEVPSGTSFDVLIRVTAQTSAGATASGFSSHLVRGIGGYSMNGRGLLVPYGATDPRPHPSATSRSDVFRGIALRADGTGGYTVSGDGEVHPFAIGTNKMPGAPGYERLRGDEARGIILRTPTSGYVLSADGELHPFGGAPDVRFSHPSIHAVDVVMLPGARGGYVLDENGRVYAFAVGRHAMPRALKTARTGVDAVAMRLRADGSSGWVLTNDGVLRPFGDAPAVRSVGVAGDAGAVAMVLGTDDGGYWIDRNNRFHTWGSGWGDPASKRQGGMRGAA